MHLPSFVVMALYIKRLTFQPKTNLIIPLYSTQHNSKLTLLYSTELPGRHSSLSTTSTDQCRIVDAVKRPESGLSLPSLPSQLLADLPKITLEAHQCQLGIITSSHITLQARMILRLRKTSSSNPSTETCPVVKRAPYDFVASRDGVTSSYAPPTSHVLHANPIGQTRTRRSLFVKRNTRSQYNRINRV